MVVRGSRLVVLFSVLSISVGNIAVVDDSMSIDLQSTASDGEVRDQQTHTPLIRYEGRVSMVLPLYPTA